MWERFFKDWYALNKSQRRGTLALIVLLLCSIFLKIFYSPSTDSNTVYFANIIVDNSTHTDTSSEHLTKLKRKDSLFFFNPNIVSAEELRMLGLPEKIIHNITKYREAGGVFYTKESLKKMYSMTDSMYQKIEPYILINNSFQSKNTSIFSQSKFNYSPNKQVLTIELNTADSNALEKLKGIGKVLAARIIKYRTRLGGFYCVDQLKEVYGIKDSLYTLIVRENKLLVDTTLIQKINIHQADFKTMIRHPYFTKDIVIKILEMQRKKESFNENTLQKIMTPDEWNKLKYYINLN